MSSRKKRNRAPRPSFPPWSDQGELAALLTPTEPGAPPRPVEPAPATFSIDEISTAVHYWGDNVQDKCAAKVSGGFGPIACLVIEVLTLMSINRERTVACKPGSKLAQVVNEALQASPLSEPTEHPADAVA